MEVKSAVNTQSKANGVQFGGFEQAIKGDKRFMAQALSEVLADTYKLMLRTFRFYMMIKNSNNPELEEITYQQHNELLSRVSYLSEELLEIGYPVSIDTFERYRKMIQSIDFDDYSNEQIKNELVKLNDYTMLRIRQKLYELRHTNHKRILEIFNDQINLHREFMKELDFIPVAQY